MAFLVQFLKRLPPASVPVRSFLRPCACAGPDVARVLSWAKHKQNQQLNKKSGKKSSKLVSGVEWSGEAWCGVA